MFRTKQERLEQAARTTQTTSGEPYPSAAVGASVAALFVQHPDGKADRREVGRLELERNMTIALKQHPDCEGEKGKRGEGGGDGCLK